jgi:hypothetical protein
MRTPVEVGDRNEAVVEEMLDLLCGVVECASRLEEGMIHAALAEAIIAATTAVRTFRQPRLGDIIKVVD